MSTPRVLVITGPTSSGKTALSLPVARRLEGEIISMDSRQVYRGMDVGTDKVDDRDRGSVPHFGLDLVDPDRRYSAGRWAREARTWIREIRGRGHLPVLVGGTGFYLKALLEPLFEEPAMDPERRELLRRWLAGREPEELRRWVRALDPTRARVAEAGGPQRMSRTLEVALLTGRPLSWWHERDAGAESPVSAGIVLLELPREVLYRRINDRARRMFREGLLEEARRLLEAGYGPGDPGMTGTGYREAVALLRGDIEMDDAVDRVQRATRRYARRQLTWFRNQLPAGEILELDATRSRSEMTEQVVRWWARIGGQASG